MMRHLLQTLFAACLAGAACFNAAHAQTKPKVTTLGPDFPKAVMFVGNSFFYYNNGLPGHVTNLEKAADPANKASYRNTMVTIGGSGLDWHDMENLLRPGGIGAYSFDEQNNVVFNKPGRQYEAVVMMDCSQCPIHPQLKGAFTDFAKKDSAIVRAHDMRPVLFMSWAYADKPEMTAELAEAYTIAGNDNDVLVIPAGLAFARVRKIQPELNLYAPDKRHPSLAGTYLASCVTYAALTGRSPVGNSYGVGLDPEITQLLQKAAWDTVQEYYGP
ncbi:hypothetical protein JQ596_20645 [Bradyrhizobium manausense]|uniref:DUF4886 domain-containing protein n=1 Tax=Bradyrhizobium TaxID=374 RepID=UPI001BAD62B8|nr:MULTISPECIES: hypothetical protein [Bradyrhizobium]MBR0827946.1 hypothetical protein [Bradyrhizobium manausense]UVO32815.1 hypothetical protein KUF59_20445 [Bradyrhizobium arachidis]